MYMNWEYLCARAERAMKREKLSRAEMVAVRVEWPSTHKGPEAVMPTHLTLLARGLEEEGFIMRTPTYTEAFFHELPLVIVRPQYVGIEYIRMMNSVHSVSVDDTPEEPLSPPVSTHVEIVAV